MYKGEGSWKMKMKHRLVIISIFFVLISLNFISAANYPAGVGVVVTQGDDCSVLGGALFNDSRICYDQEDHHVYTDDISRLYNTMYVLGVMISEENRLRKEVNEMKDELDETRAELRELKEIVKNINESHTNSNRQILTGASIEDNGSGSLENQDKGILAFFRKLFWK